MKMPSSVAQLAAEERGGVLVMVVVWLPIIILFATFVVDVGSWFEHKRHLQLQADAGALAGGGKFAGVFSDCSDDPIVTETRRYAGDTGPYNFQVPPTEQANVHVLINSTLYWNEGGTDYSDGGAPCATKMVDVKITEANLPWFFGGKLVPAINAHARVSIQQVDTLAGVLPVGIPDVNPKSARAYFVNESTGAVIASAALTKTGVSAEGDAVWDNTAAPVSVPINTSRIGVRIALGGGTSTTCGDPLVECYDLNGTSGIVFIRGYSTAGSGAQPNAPLARDVHLFNGDCPDPYFNAGGCTIGVSATVDFGVADPTIPRTAGGLEATLKATMGGVTKDLTFDPATGVWQSSPANYFTVTSGIGANPLIALEWEEHNGTVGTDDCRPVGQGGNKCKGTIAGVQRTYAATDATSGPIKVAQVWKDGTFWWNSFETGTTQDLSVRIAVRGSLKNASDVSDPEVTLRVTGSQNQSIDCDNIIPNLRGEIAAGCGPTYEVNTGTPCPAYNQLWNTSQPWNCVKIQTGGAVGQAEKGLEDRILGGASTCSAGPNNWSLFPDLPDGDPRIVPVFLTPFGSFSGSGNDIVPVTDFATFYVTNWHSDPCSTSNPPRGFITGHFIKYITVLPSGGGGALCDFGSFGACVAVLTE